MSLGFKGMMVALLLLDGEAWWEGLIMERRRMRKKMVQKG